MIKGAKARNVPDEGITSAIEISYSETDISSAISIASNFKCSYESNKSLLKQSASNFCVGEYAQYKEVMEGFTKSNCDDAIKNDIEFVKFLLTFLQTKSNCFTDAINKGYDNSVDVLTRLNNVKKT